MLDLSLANKRRKIRVPAAVKAFFIGLAFLPIAYGALILLDYKAFFNNSVPTLAYVVNYESSNVPAAADLRSAVSAGDFGPHELFFVPGFYYRHENGEAYVGRALADASNWRMRPGELVEIRYNRGRPHLAQPVTFMTFWAAPVLFIGGGVAMILALLFGFYLVEREPSWQRPVNLRRGARLNLRR